MMVHIIQLGGDPMLPVLNLVGRDHSERAKWSVKLESHVFPPIESA